MAECGECGRRGFYAKRNEDRAVANRREKVWDYFDCAIPNDPQKRVVDMPCELYLSLAEPIPADDGKRHASMKEKMAALDAVKRFTEIPRLEIRQIEDGDDAKVFGHDGRHRAMIMQRLGFKSIPVLLCADNFRFDGEMPLDKKGNPRPFPKWLWCQNDKGRERGQLKFMFPISQDDAKKPYYKDI